MRRPWPIAYPPKPDDPDVEVAYKECQRPDGSIYDEWYWSSPNDGPSLAELAQRAFGSLQIPAFDPTFNPPGRTNVNPRLSSISGLPLSPTVSSGARLRV